MAEDSAHVVAASARTPLGRSLAASAAAVRAGLARFERDPELRDTKNRPIVTSRACWLPSDLPPTERLTRLARPAACQALWLLRDRRKARVSAFIGVSAAGRPGRPAGVEAAVRAAVREAIKRSSSLVELELVANEHASGLMALQLALEHLEEGRAELCLVGGVDSYLDDDVIEELDQGRRLRSSRQRFGFIPGEGAGFLLLAPRDTPLPALAVVLGTSQFFERGQLAHAEEHERGEPAHAPAQVAHGSVVTGEALNACFQRALASCSDEHPVARLIGDLNGEPHRADELGMTIVRAGKRIVRPPEVLAPAACWGDVGAASGPLAVGLALASDARGWGVDRTLVWCASDSGERAATLVLRARRDES